MPTNLYGPNDNYDLNNSHVLPGLLRKFIEATKNKAENVVVWGTGEPLREFLYVDDLADACLYFMNNEIKENYINIGCGKDITIKDLAYLIKDITGYKGEIIFDTTKPNGTFRKLLDVGLAKSLGWEYKVSLEEGIKRTYELVKNNF